MERKALKVIAIEPYTRTPGHFEWFSARTCDGLARRGHQVTLVTYGGISPPNLPRVLSFRIVDAAPASEHELDARLFRGKIDVRAERAFLHRQFREFRTFRCAFDIVQKEGAFDVVHFVDAYPVTLVYALHRLMNRRQTEQTALVANLHIAPRLIPGKSLRGRPHDALFRYALRRMISKELDAVIVMDEIFKGEVVAHLRLSESARNKLHLFPHGMDEGKTLDDREGARRRLNLAPDETIFLLFGVLRKDKGIDVVLQAIKGLPACRLLIAGGPHDYDAAAVHQLIHARGCEAFVSTEIKYIEASRMRDYFLASDSVILPYTTEFKGQSGILTHACAYGRSVIASNVAAVGTTIKETGMGLVVEPESADQLRAAMQQFLSLDQEARSQMEAAARAVAAARSWDSICARLDNLYDEILSRKRPGTALT